MVDFISSAGESLVDQVFEAGEGILKPGLNVEVKNYREDLKLSFCNHFLYGGTCEETPDRESENEIAVSYTNNAGKKCEGALVCELKSTSGELPRNTFLMLGWKVPIFKYPRVYMVVLDAEEKISKWEPQNVEDQHNQLRDKLNQHMGILKQNWKLSNETKMRLILDLAGANKYNLKVTIWEDEPTDESADPPIEFNPSADMLTDDMTRDGDATSNGFSLWSRCRKVVINIQNKCKDIKLDSGTCTVLKGNKNHYTISSPIPPDGRKNAIVRAKCRMGVPGSIECCIVYELLDPQRQREPLCQGYRVFIVIYLFVDSPSKYETKVFLFRTTSRSFAGGKNDIIKLRDNIIKNAEYSIDDLSVWNINEQVLSLKPDFVYGDPARLKVTLEKIESDTGRDLILYEMDT